MENFQANVDDSSKSKIERISHIGDERLRAETPFRIFFYFSADAFFAVLHLAYDYSDLCYLYYHYLSYFLRRTQN